MEIQLGVMVVVYAVGGDAHEGPRHSQPLLYGDINVKHKIGISWSLIIV